MFGMLRAASAKFGLDLGAVDDQRVVETELVEIRCSALVLPSFMLALSSTMMPPSLALAESACLSASARTFFGRSIAWLRGTGPNERPPPRNRLTLAEP